MQSVEKLEDTWNDLVARVNELPLDERLRYQRQVGKFVHDVRQSISVTLSAEALMRRKKDLTPEDIELLDMIHNAGKRMLKLLTELAQPFDNGIHIPIKEASDQPEK